MATMGMEEFEAAFSSTQADWLGGDAAKFAFSIERITLKSGDVIAPQRAGVTAIVGANNAGKSTILRELVEWISHEPSHPQPPRLSIDSVDINKSGRPADLFAWLGSNSSFVLQGTTMGFVRPMAGFQQPQSIAYYWDQGGLGLGQLAPFLQFYGNAAGRFSIGGAAEMRDSVDDPPTHPVHYLQDSKHLNARISKVSESVFHQPLTLDALARTVRLRVGKLDVEAPRVDDVPPEYRRAMSALRPLDDQGDGMKGFFGQILPVVAATYPLIVIDEPEAFLHPPQAHALGVELGRLAVERGVQILVATHDRNLLTGLLDSDVSVSVVRASRAGEQARAFQLDSTELRKLWNDAVLKYTNVLDGLFHRVVVLAEAEGDCAYLAAALDCPDREAMAIPRNEILFIPTGGKDAMWKVARALKAVRVPVIAAPDLDMVSDETNLARLVEALSGTWTSELEALWKRATAAQREAKEPARVGHVLEAIVAAFSSRREESFSAEVREELLAQARSKESPWSAVKEYGVDAFKGTAREDLLKLLDTLELTGVVLVRAGELERLAPEVAARKGPGWLQAALEKNAQCNATTQAHIDRLLATGERLLSQGPA